MTIRISERVGALPGYPLAEIPSIKRRLLEAGVDVIDLGAGDNDTPPPAVVAALPAIEPPVAVNVPLLQIPAPTSAVLPSIDASPDSVRHPPAESGGGK